MSLPDLIIAVDPGATCGFVTWSSGEVQTSGEISPESLLDWLESTLETPPWDSLSILIAYERWRVTGKTARYTEQLDAPYTIGVIRWLARKHNNVELLPQQVIKDGASSPCSDKILRALDWYRRTPDGHENDAKRQLYVALIQRGWAPPPHVLEKIFSE